VMLKSVSLNNDYAVSKFKYAFPYSQITTITLGNKITTIGNSAFSSSSSLSSITIPDSVTSIGDLSFSSCVALSKVRYLGINDPGKSSKNAFDSCDKLSYISVSNDYKDDVFCGVNVLKEEDNSSEIPNPEPDHPESEKSSNSGLSASTIIAFFVGVSAATIIGVVLFIIYRRKAKHSFEKLDDLRSMTFEKE